MEITVDAQIAFQFQSLSGRQQSRVLSVPPASSSGSECTPLAARRPQSLSTTLGVLDLRLDELASSSMQKSPDLGEVEALSRQLRRLSFQAAPVIGVAGEPQS